MFFSRQILRFGRGGVPVLKPMAVVEAFGSNEFEDPETKEKLRLFALQQQQLKMDQQRATSAFSKESDKIIEISRLMDLGGWKRDVLQRPCGRSCHSASCGHSCLDIGRLNLRCCTLRQEMA